MRGTCPRYLKPIWLILFLASCPFLSSHTSLHQPINANIVPAFSTKSEGANQPEMLTFPSMVTTQKLEPVKKPFEEGTGYRLHFSTLPHKNPNKPKHIQVPAQGPIQITFQSGPSFALIDANGLDGQATVKLPTDVYQGYLRLAGPASTHQPLSLKYEDPLYYVDHTLGRDDLEKPKGSFTVLAQNDNKLQITSRCSSDPDSLRVWQITNPTSNPIEYHWEIKDSDQKGIEIAPPGESYIETDTEPNSNTLILKVNNKKHDNQASKADRCAPGQVPAADTSRWWNLGSRVLPIPADWHSDHGQNLVLKLNNQGISDFTMRWVRTPDKQASLPLGTKLIGSQGGTVELQGVAKLEIPPNSISTPTLVRIIQEQQTLSRKTPPERTLPDSPLDPVYSDSPVGTEFLSPVIRIEPFNLNLNKVAFLEIKSSFPVEKYNDSAYYFLQTNELSTQNYYNSTIPLRQISVFQGKTLKITDPLPIKKFQYSALLILSPYKGINNQNQLHSNFSIQNNDKFNCIDYINKYNILISLSSNSATSKNFKYNIDPIILNSNSSPTDEIWVVLHK